LIGELNMRKDPAFKVHDSPGVYTEEEDPSGVDINYTPPTPPDPPPPLTGPQPIGIAIVGQTLIPDNPGIS
jgi:hypothetical protein